MVIKNLSTKSVIDVVHIAESCFGKGFMTPKAVECFINDGCNSFVLSVNNNAVGFALLKIENKQTKDNYLKAFISEYQQVGIIQTIAILPTHQQKGFGSKLLKQCLTYLSENKCESIFYPAWIENNKDYFLATLNKAGFSSVKIFKSFWYNESLIENYSCVKCGLPPCNCSLNLYHKII